MYKIISALLPKAYVPVVVLVCSLLATIAIAIAVDRSSEAREIARFQLAVDGVADSIEQRLETYRAILRGFSGLFSASREVTPDEYRAYLNTLDLNQRYPGTLGIGFSPRTSAADYPEIANRIKETYGVLPAHTPSRTEGYPVQLIEPFNERNAASLGYDMYEEPSRRFAMDRARDTGMASVTRRTTLAQEIDDNRQAGVLMYVPVYSGGDTPTSIEERRELISGFVFSPLRMDDLIRGIFRDNPTNLVAFEIYDGEPLEENLLHRSDTTDTSRISAFVSDTQLVVAGQPWTIRSYSTPQFERIASARLLPYILTGGALLSIVLYFLIRNLYIAQASAESYERQKDEFIAIAGHELKTPLSSIRAYTQLIARDPSDTDKNRKYLHTVESQADRAITLIGDLLDVSKMRSGPMKLDIKEFDLETLVKDAAEGMSGLYPDHEIRVTGRIRKTLTGDEKRISQVITNLLSNAAKYSPHATEIGVEMNETPMEAIVSVSDSGPGIDAKYQKKIFERFYRVRSHSGHIPGTGIGLYVAHRIVMEHGGRIWVQSSPGAGSTFSISLPFPR
jgi:signal transduction histidine kinase